LNSLTPLIATCPALAGGPFAIEQSIGVGETVGADDVEVVSMDD
jgi:hypothetical protein